MLADEDQQLHDGVVQFNEEPQEPDYRECNVDLAVNRILTFLVTVDAFL